MDSVAFSFYSWNFWSQASVASANILNWAVSSPNSRISDKEGTVCNFWINWIAQCISLSSSSTLPYKSSCFAPYIYKITSDSSSITLGTKPISSSMRVASIWGLLAWVFFLAKGFCRETFLFFGVSVLVGGSFSGVSSPSPCFSTSSPPPYSFTLSPRPTGYPDPFSLEALSFSSVCTSWTSSFSFSSSYWTILHAQAEWPRGFL